jgi:hypothetical protein
MGIELTTETFAGIVPVSALPHILGGSFPADALSWMTDAGRVRQLHIIICARDAVRVISVPRPGAAGSATA